MLFTILARRHAVLALKQIAHHTGTGEPLFAGDLLGGFAGGQQLIGGVAQALANHLTAEQFCRAMRPHPSFEEAMTAALEDLCEKLG